MSFLPHDIQRLHQTESNSSQWLISSIYITANTLKRWPQQGNRKSHFGSSDYFTTADITDSYITSGIKCSLASEKSNVT